MDASLEGARAAAEALRAAKREGIRERAAASKSESAKARAGAAADRAKQHAALAGSRREFANGVRARLADKGEAGVYTPRGPREPAPIAEAADDDPEAKAAESDGDGDDYESKLASYMNDARLPDDYGTDSESDDDLRRLATFA